MVRKAVALDENDALCHLAMLWAHVDCKAYELAEQHLARALALNPNQRSVQSNRGAFFVCIGEPENAIESLTEAIRLDPFFHAFVVLGRAWRGAFCREAL